MFPNNLSRATSQSLSASSKIANLLATKRVMLNSTSLLRNFSSNRAFRASLALRAPMAGAQQDNFVNGSSAVYVDHLYEQWREDPASVHASWRAYFENEEASIPQAYVSPPTLGQSETQSMPIDQILSSLKNNNPDNGVMSMDATSFEKANIDSFRVMQLIRAFMIDGHFSANLDPLRL